MITAMQQKHIFRSIRAVIWGGLIAWGLSGCSKDFLDRNALDAIPSEEFWKSEQQLKLAANGCYDFLKGKNVVDMENLGDNTIYPPMSDYLNISTGNFDFTVATVNNEWVNQFKGIRRCNHFMRIIRKHKAYRRPS